ncbi:MAG: hypothetical protein IPO54_09010 [Micavibrio sp.]|nr:hypothetical protein [Micavibrio sp.]
MIFAALVMMAAPASADPPEGGMAAAKAYVKVADVPKMMNEMVTAMAQNPRSIGRLGNRADPRDVQLCRDRKSMVEKRDLAFHRRGTAKLADSTVALKASRSGKCPLHAVTRVPFVQQNRGRRQKPGRTTDNPTTP